MIQFLQTSSVVAITVGNPLTRSTNGQENLVANLYNSAGAQRTVTITAGSNIFAVTLAAGASGSIALLREGNLSIIADNSGVFGWIGKHAN